MKQRGGKGWIGLKYRAGFRTNEEGVEKAREEREGMLITGRGRKRKTVEGEEKREGLGRFAGLLKARRFTFHPTIE